MKIYFDIETVPSPNLRQEAENSVRPPASIKKPETLLRWEQEERPGLVEESFRKFALSPETGEIICIGAMTDDDDEFVRCRRPGEPEIELLSSFFNWVSDQIASRQQIWRDSAGYDWPVGPEDVFFVCHNAQFDLVFLRGRCIALDLRPPFRIPGTLDRPGKGYTCTMQLWAGYGGRVSLRRLALALGFPDPKETMKGGDVYDEWTAGRTDKIAAYCLHDVRTVKNIYQRMLAIGL